MNFTTYHYQGVRRHVHVDSVYDWCTTYHYQGVRRDVIVDGVYVYVVLSHQNLHLTVFLHHKRLDTKHNIRCGDSRNRQTED